MQYQIEDKVFVNDSGNQVKYKRLVITGYLNGNIETIELPISKEQAIIYKAMTSDKPEIYSRKSTSDEKEAFAENNITKKSSTLFDNDDEEQDFFSKS